MAVTLPALTSGSAAGLGEFEHAFVLELLVALLIAFLAFAVRPLRRRIIRLAHAVGRSVIHLRMGNRIAAAGITNFYVGRSDWGRFRRPPQLVDYLLTATRTVQIGCYWLAQGTLEGVPRACAELAERGVDVTLVVIDPTSAVPNVLSADLNQSRDAIRASIRASLEQLELTASELSAEGRARLHIGTTRALPQAAVIMIDVDETVGRIQLEFRPFRTPRADSFSIELSARRDGRLFRVYRGALTSFFREANYVS